jgi:spore germination protein
MKTPALLPALALFSLTAWVIQDRPPADAPERPAFREIWAYLMRGEEKELTGSEPITDLCYFSAGLARTGRIMEEVSRPALTLKDGLQPAMHLVISELANPALMHFSLNPAYGVRPLLIQDICRVSRDFDGVQIDFEVIAREDAQYFFDFLKELRGSLPAEKKLSIAAPARTELVPDAFEYSRIAPFVDRIIIMAYDEHWSTSAPGPVASLPWCAKVADYVNSVVDHGKIVMGLPLYGRAWQDKRLARALRLRNVRDLVAEKQSRTGYSTELGAFFEYPESVTVTVYYDNERSITEKLRLYMSKGIGAVSFWRVGQGPPQLWSSIDSAAPPAPAAPGEAAAASGGPPSPSGAAKAGGSGSGGGPPPDLTTGSATN